MGGQSAWLLRSKDSPFLKSLHQPRGFSWFHRSQLPHCCCRLTHAHKYVNLEGQVPLLEVSLGEYNPALLYDSSGIWGTSPPLSFSLNILISYLYMTWMVYVSKHFLHKITLVHLLNKYLLRCCHMSDPVLDTESMAYNSFNKN